MTLPSYEVDDIIIKHCKEIGFTDIYKAGDYEGFRYALKIMKEDC